MDCLMSAVSSIFLMCLSLSVCVHLYLYVRLYAHIHMIDVHIYTHISVLPDANVCGRVDNDRYICSVGPRGLTVECD